MILKGLLNKFRSNAQFCLYYRRGKFHFGHTGLETLKTKIHSFLDTAQGARGGYCEGNTMCRSKGINLNFKLKIQGILNVQYHIYRYLN